MRLAFYGGAGGVAAALVIMMLWPPRPMGSESARLESVISNIRPVQGLAANQMVFATRSLAAPTSAPVALPAAAAPAMPPPGAAALSLGGDLAGNRIAEDNRTSSGAGAVSGGTPPIGGSNAASVDASSGLLATAEKPARPTAPPMTGGRGGFGGGGRQGAAGGGRRGGAGAGGGGAVGGAGMAVPATEPPETFALKDATAALDKPAPASPVASPAASPAVFAQRMVRSDLAPGQDNTAVKNTPAAPAGVLASFQIERAGDQVRVTDADGSEYVGRVVDQVVMARTRAANNDFANNSAVMNGVVINGAVINAAIINNAAINSNPGGSSANGAQLNYTPQQNLLMGGFTFQVSGLNRKINQNVTLTGDFFSAPLQQYANAAGNGASPTQSQAQNLSQGAVNNSQNLNYNYFQNLNYNNLQNGNVNISQQNGMSGAQVWRVSGRVQVGPSNQFDLEAVTLQP
jgi:hypothetical protein